MKRKRGSKTSAVSIKMLCTIIGLLCVLVGFGVYIKQSREASYPARSDELSAEEYQLKLEQEAQEEMLEEQALQELMAASSFYQKLYYGLDVNILIVGDSIGAGTSTESWAGQLSAFITEQYGSNVNLKNVSMGGNTSYAGYTRVMSLNDGINYDLAIVCYGQNDDTEDFSLYYESIFCAINSTFENCEIISILESAQRDYTEKIVEIQALAEWYNVDVADTIQTFAESGYAYEELTDDGIHPNDLGKTIYFETVQEIVVKNVAEDAVYSESIIVPVNEDVSEFGMFEYISIDSFEKVDLLTYRFETTAAANGLGVYYTYLIGENTFDVFVDGELLVATEFTWSYDFSQAHIVKVADDIVIEESIEIVFSTQEQAENFMGVVLSGV